MGALTTVQVLCQTAGPAQTASFEYTLCPNERSLDSFVYAHSGRAHLDTYKVNRSGQPPTPQNRIATSGGTCIALVPACTLYSCAPLSR
mmetsp:Transcript_10676/g.16392  ORF Transcript_10676/g.16392 Transcript_10676/m.16392 type:complete len:89 (-) Transcript_10676:1166-1432(-)